jgi:hypothetical protein
MSDLVSFCKRCLSVTGDRSVAIPLAVIGWARTEGDPEAAGRGWSGAFGVSIDLHGEAPKGLDKQIEHAAGVLRQQQEIHMLDSSGLMWTPQEPIEPVLGPNNRPVQTSDRLMKEIERSASLSFAWDRPADMAHAVEYLSAGNRPVTFDDVAAATSFRADPAPHYQAADVVVRDGIAAWLPQATQAASKETGWVAYAVGAGVLGGLFWLIARAR